MRGWREILDFARLDFALKKYVGTGAWIWRSYGTVLLLEVPGKTGGLDWVHQNWGQTQNCQGPSVRRAPEGPERWVRINHKDVSSGVSWGPVFSFSPFSYFMTVLRRGSL